MNLAYGLRIRYFIQVQRIVSMDSALESMRMLSTYENRTTFIDFSCGFSLFLGTALYFMNLALFNIKLPKEKREQGNSGNRA